MSLCCCDKQTITPSIYPIRATVGKKESANGLQKFSSPQGRYGAPRPPCSMGQIIHNQATNHKNQEPAGVKSMPATNYQGILHTGPYPNNASQSTPNMNVGQRILNNAYNSNPGDANSMNFNRNPINAETYSLQNIQQNTATGNREVYNQNQAPAVHNYQQYNNTQPPFINENAIQNQLQYNATQNSNYPSNLQNSLHTVNHTNIAADPNLYPRENIQQTVSYHNVGNVQPTTSEGPQIANNYPNVIGSQEQINLPQHYAAAVNQQFQNLNLNNQVQQDYTNSRVVPSNQNIVQPMDSKVPTELNKPPTGNVAYSANNPSNMGNMNWNRQNFPNTQNVQYANNPRNQMQENQTQNMAMPQQTLSNPSYHNVIQPNTYPNQNSLQNTSMETNNPLQNSTVQFSQQQFSTPQPYEKYNVPQGSDFSHSNPQLSTHQPVNNYDNTRQAQYNVIQQPSYSGTNIPVPYNLPHGAQHMCSQSARDIYPQNLPVQQTATIPVHDEGRLSHSTSVQMSRHNVNETSSAPNMSNNVIRRDSTSTSKNMENAQMENKTTPAVQGQEVNRDMSKGDMNPATEEESLPYGYPPQFTESQVLTRSSPISIRQP